MKAFMVSAILIASGLQANIQTCSQANSLRKDHWISAWNTHPQRNIFREQIERTVTILKSAKPYLEWIPESEDLKAMTDDQLDQLGNGIKIQYLGKNDTLVQFGLHGDKYIEILFERNSCRVSTRIYYFNGFCLVMKDIGSQYTSHLPSIRDYSEW